MYVTINIASRSPSVSLVVDFELYTLVEHNRALIQSQASAIVSFIHGDERFSLVNEETTIEFRLVERLER